MAVKNNKIDPLNCHNFYWELRKRIENISFLFLVEHLIENL